MRKTSGKGLLSLLLAGLLLLSVPAGCAAKPPADEPVFGEEEKLPPVELTMPEYQLTYAGEMKDIIKTREITEGEQTGLEFYVQLSGKDVTVFVLYFDSENGEYVQFLTDEAGNRIPVAFDMAELPAGLSEADTETFYLAQESVNDMASSIKLRQ